MIIVLSSSKGMRSLTSASPIKVVMETEVITTQLDPGDSCEKTSSCSHLFSTANVANKDVDAVDTTSISCVSRVANLRTKLAQMHGYDLPKPSGLSDTSY